jgi:hypothetical protein
MEKQALAEQPKQTHERTMFDVTASIKMLRYDYDNLGYFHPETEQQVLNEDLSLIVEGVGRASLTKFVLKREGSGLVYFKDGDWQSYGGMVKDGLLAAEKVAEDDEEQRFGFLVDMRLDDVQNEIGMRRLTPGQKRTWTSPYRHEIAKLYGKDFMEYCGFVADREMGFVYQATCLDDGSILLESQTLDKSDSDAFSAIDAAIEGDPQVELSELVELHDAVLEDKFGQKFNAGRTNFEQNAWDLILAQKPLINHLLNELKRIAAEPIYGDELETAAKRHIYGVWATFKRVIDGEITFNNQPSQTYGGVALNNILAASTELYVRQQVDQSFNQFVKEGRVLVGCGGSIRILQGEEDIMNASPSDVFASIFGGKSCPEIKDGQETNCPHCHKKVRAIVKNRREIFCNNEECKLAAPGIRKVRRLRQART